MRVLKDSYQINPELVDARRLDHNLRIGKKIEEKQMLVVSCVLTAGDQL